MIVRHATASDLLAIQTLNNELFELEIKNFDPYLIKDWALSKEGEEYFKNAIENAVVFVAEDNGVVVGYICGELTSVPYYSFKIAELCNMCVTMKYRKRGVGTMLTNKFFEYFKQQGVFRFSVTASFKNECAKNFYKKIGFTESNMTYFKF